MPIAPRTPPSILDKIIAQRRLDVAAAINAVPEATLRAKIAARAPANDFAACLRAASARTNGLCVLAEMKRASPSKGDIAPDADAAAQGVAYASVGAAVISVLTEQHWFKGTLADMRAVRVATQQRAAAGFASGPAERPAVLRKDFIVDEYQIAEARAHGADTVLLIVATLSKSRLAELIACCRAPPYGIEPLVEVASDAEMRIALDAGSRVIGINNRNLHTFELDLETTPRLAEARRRRARRRAPNLRRGAPRARPATAPPAGRARARRGLGPADRGRRGGGGGRRARPPDRQAVRDGAARRARARVPARVQRAGDRRAHAELACAQPAAGRRHRAVRRRPRRPGRRVDARDQDGEPLGRRAQQAPQHVLEPAAQDPRLARDGRHDRRRGRARTEQSLGRLQSA